MGVNDILVIATEIAVIHDSALLHVRFQSLNVLELQRCQKKCREQRQRIALPESVVVSNFAANVFAHLHRFLEAGDQVHPCANKVRGSAAVQ